MTNASDTGELVPRTVKPGELIVGKWVAGIVAAVIVAGLSGIVAGVMTAASSYAQARTEAAVMAERLNAITEQLAELKTSLGALAAKTAAAGDDRLRATEHAAWWRDEKPSLEIEHERLRDRIGRLESRVEDHQDGHPRRIEALIDELRRQLENVEKRWVTTEARLARIEQQLGARK